MNNFIWTPTGTDITIRWRKLGWIPPSEQQSYRDKWKFYQELPMQHLGSEACTQYEETLRRNKVARIK